MERIDIFFPIDYNLNEIIARYFKVSKNRKIIFCKFSNLKINFCYFKNSLFFFAKKKAFAKKTKILILMASDMRRQVSIFRERERNFFSSFSEQLCFLAHIIMGQKRFFNVEFLLKFFKNTKKIFFIFLEKKGTFFYVNERIYQSTFFPFFNLFISRIRFKILLKK